ncbi:sensor histidine kinase [Acidipropionibacterium timonense]|uniref:sensor histidine kinase n=1 Tax=Acidipropionibacterium timonense TaxID=2161818 RepID=UPI0010311FF7|nr:ATP-binding protein [Acidipropionibacterium timonense]
MSQARSPIDATARPDVGPSADPVVAPSVRAPLRTVVWALSSPDITPRLARTARIIGTVSGWVAWGVSTLEVIDQLVESDLGRTGLTLTLLFLVLDAVPMILATVWTLQDDPGARAALASHVALCVLAAMIAPAVWRLGPSSRYPPASHIVIMAVAMSWCCLRWQTAASLILLDCLGIGLFLSARSGPMAWLDAVPNALLALMATSAWVAIVMHLRDADREATASLGASLTLVRSRARSAESHRWDAVIHDHVLGALGTAARAVDEIGDRASRILAGQALDAIDRGFEAGRRRSLAEELSATAERLGLSARIDITGDPPDAVRDSFVIAAAEAVTNVARHSGVDEVVISGRFTPRWGRLRIEDHGRGFDPGQVPDERRGLRGSVRASMEVVSGRSHVVSRPGRGTTVLLSWDAEHATPRPTLSRSFRTMVVLLGLYLAVQLLEGVLHADLVRSMPVFVAGAAILVALVIHTMTTARIGVTKAIVIMSLTVDIQVVLLVNLQPGLPPGFQEWFIGFGIGIFGPLCWRRRSIWCPLGPSLAWPVTTLVAGWLSGQGPLDLFLTRASSFVLPAILSFAAVWVARSSDAALATIQSSRSRTLRDTALRARAEAEREEASRRLTQISAEPLDMLSQLASGAPLTDDVKRRCALLEASTRDHLVASAVMSPQVTGEVRRARERGVVVALTSTGGPSGEPAEAFDLFRRAVVAIVGAAPEGARVTARWHPESTSSMGTVLVDRPVPTDLPMHAEVPCEEVGTVLADVEVTDLDTRVTLHHRSS